MLKARFALICAVCITILAFGIAGCSDSPNQLSVQQLVASNPVTVYGKVVDKQTTSGIAGATVYIKVAGSWRSTSTMGSTGTSGAENQIGNFTFSGLPVRTNIPVIVKGPASGSYLQLQGIIQTEDYSGGSDGVNSQINQDLGTLPMEIGVTATMYVVDDITGADVVKSDSSPVAIYYGLMNATTLTSSFTYVPSIQPILADQDATDLNKYTIVLPQTAEDNNCGGLNNDVELLVPAIDADGDGKYDYESTTVCFEATANGLLSQHAELTTNVALTPLTNTTVLAFVTDNIVAASNKVSIGAGTDLDLIGADDSLMYFFNMPVEIVTSATGTTNNAGRLTYTDNFKELAAAATTVDVALTASLSLDNTVLTLNPAVTLTEKQDYTLNLNSVSIKNTVNDTVVALDTLATVTGLTVDATGTGTIGSTPTVVVDNLNHCTNGADIVSGDAIDCTVAVAGTPYLVFPEPVWGTVSAVKTQEGATETLIYGPPTTLTGQGGVAWFEMMASNDPNQAFNNHGLNLPSGAYYLFNISTLNASMASMNDHLAGVASQVTLEINAYDADGNNYTTLSTFNVQ